MGAACQGNPGDDERELCIFCSKQTECLAMEVLDKQAFSVNSLIKQVFSELFLNMVRSLLL